MQQVIDTQNKCTLVCMVSRGVKMNLLLSLQILQTLWRVENVRYFEDMVRIVWQIQASYTKTRLL